MPVMSILGKAGRRAGRLVRGRASRGTPFFFDEVRPDDTYLVSFPRSGNTYLRHLVASLMVDRAPTPQEVQELVPDVHWSSSRRRPPGEGPLVAKSHAPVRSVPAKVVYLVRDGRSALLSYYLYLQRRGRHVENPDAMLAGGAVWPCSWPDHVEGWLGYLGGRDHALVVRYEDLVAHPARVLSEVAVLVGLPTQDYELDRAVRRSSIDSMRAAERHALPGSLNFVGTGQREWRDVFSSEALRRFDASCAGLFETLGYPRGSQDA